MVLYRCTCDNSGGALYILDGQHRIWCFSEYPEFYAGQFIGVILITSRRPDITFLTLFRILHAGLPQDGHKNEERGLQPALVRKIELLEQWFAKTFPDQLFRRRSPSERLDVTHKKKVYPVTLIDCFMNAGKWIIENRKDSGVGKALINLDPRTDNILIQAFKDLNESWCNEMRRTRRKEFDALVSELQESDRAMPYLKFCFMGYSHIQKQ